jgi:hypothetical protein
VNVIRKLVNFHNVRVKAFALLIRGFQKADEKCCTCLLLIRSLILVNFSRTPLTRILLV